MNDRDSGAQLALPLQLDEFARFDTFIVGRSSVGVAHVESAARGRETAQIWLAGPAGAGKSHLLQAACQSASDAGRRAMYVPLGSDLCQSPGMLEGLDSVDMLALDDVHCVARREDWERALFGIFEAFTAQRSCLLLAAAGRPAEMRFNLPDLGSRAAAATVYRLETLDDEARQAALIFLAGRRGIEVDAAAARYLLERIDRDMYSVRLWLDRLDEASLAARRRLTTRFIAEVMARYTRSGD